MNILSLFTTSFQICKTCFLLKNYRKDWTISFKNYPFYVSIYWIYQLLIQNNHLYWFKCDQYATSCSLIFRCICPLVANRETTLQFNRNFTDSCNQCYILSPQQSKLIKGSCPLLVFVNPKSGGLKGREILYSFRKLLNPHQVFELTSGGPLPGLDQISFWMMPDVWMLWLTDGWIVFKSPALCTFLHYVCGLYNKMFC